jgi:hypothetical protein
VVVQVVAAAQVVRAEQQLGQEQVGKDLLEVLVQLMGRV